MNRFWIGVGLLLVLLGVGVWAMQAMDRVHGSIVQDLQKSVEAAQDENWEAADTLAQSAASRWEESRRFVSSMADHTVLDEIDGIFAQAQAYREHRLSADYTACCARLSKLIEALQESHDLNWRNLL